MKKFLFGAFFTFCVSNITYAGLSGTVHTADDRARSQQSTCLYKYLSCRESCEYHQDESAVSSCQASCDRQYSCRPSKNQYELPNS